MDLLLQEEQRYACQSHKRGKRGEGGNAGDGLNHMVGFFSHLLYCVESRGLPSCLPEDRTKADGPVLQSEKGTDLV